MIDVQWIKSFGSSYAVVGNSLMNCMASTTRSGRIVWSTAVRAANKWRYGPVRRNSLARAKEDCIRMVTELLVDCQESLKFEMASFGLEIWQE